MVLDATILISKARKTHTFFFIINVIKTEQRKLVKPTVAERMTKNIHDKVLKYRTLE